jgi:hypothetical protein
VGTGNGSVVSLIPSVINGTEFFVLTLTTMQGQPPCATSGRFALSATDPKYRTVVTGLLQAYFQGGQVFARGLGTCDTYSGSEDLAYVCFNNGAPC